MHAFLAQHACTPHSLTLSLSLSSSCPFSLASTYLDPLLSDSEGQALDKRLGVFKRRRRRAGERLKKTRGRGGWGKDKRERARGKRQEEMGREGRLRR